MKKHNLRTRTGESLLAAGFSVRKAETKIPLDGRTAGVRFDGSRPVALVIRVKDNAADPISIVRIFRMHSSTKRRSAVIASTETFHVSNNDKEPSAKKYGESSYYLTTDKMPAGEYGSTATRPTDIDEKTLRLDLRHRRRTGAAPKQTRPTSDTPSPGVSLPYPSEQAKRIGQQRRSGRSRRAPRSL